VRDRQRKLDKYRAEDLVILVTTPLSPPRVTLDCSCTLVLGVLVEGNRGLVPCCMLAGEQKRSWLERDLT